MRRVLEPEILDVLAPGDPDAVRSRRDLQRVNRVHGARSILARELRLAAAAAPVDRPLRILELGCGDGSLLLALANRLATRLRSVDLTLLDREPVVEASTLAAFSRLGWRAEIAKVDVLDWAAGNTEPALATARAPPAGTSPQRGGCTPARWDLVVANLFLHHFDAAALELLLSAVAARAECFAACEPRRAWLPLLGSRLIGALGVNAVTRNDAVLSVRAGFVGAEIGAAWPSRSAAMEWHLVEWEAGLFNHCFRARRAMASNGST